MSTTHPQPPPPSTPGLSPSELSFFHENGYLVIPNYLTPTEVSNLLSTTNTLLNDFPLSTHPLTRFTTGDEDLTAKHVGDEYFLTSANKIHFFFEPDAFNPDTDPPTLKKPKHFSINKIGHALHALSPPFAAITTPNPKEQGVGTRTAAIARDLSFRDPRVLQSMVICKQPQIGAAVRPHIDSEFLYTDPPSAVGWWIALQDAGSGNGGLGVWKGSHKRGYVRRRFVRCQGGEGGTEFVGWAGKGRGLARELEEGGDREKYVPRDEDFVQLDVPAGGLVLIHGNLLHQSERNTSEKSRFAYTFHVIEGAEGWVYDERNWLQPEEKGVGAKGFTSLFGGGN
ncbi:hypothetical protein AJ79_07891 [Helicocarpus griseus UAMH5409]|uniref:Phytanoyl-CoA dioxygenase n=1 Tax=Helicocarpus griseus UAMH5409 TaxID=1447875 RepID=A0A2B7WYA2_9EURO|nr:hypothetical protein AJ79_07891 [Helicocarpus griseus UAMH5409]